MAEAEGVSGCRDAFTTGPEQTLEFCQRGAQSDTAPRWTWPGRRTYVSRQRAAESAMDGLNSRRAWSSVAVRARARRCCSAGGGVGSELVNLCGS